MPMMGKKFISQIHVRVEKQLGKTYTEGEKKVVITKELLLQSWKSRVALYTPPLSAGVDIVIPVVRGSQRMDNVPLIASVDTISLIAVQVKNREKTVSVSKIIPGLLSSVIYEEGLKPVMGIVCNVGAGGASLGITVTDDIPVLTLGMGHITKALNLPAQVCALLNTISSFEEGPQERILRTYDPTLVNTEISNHAFYMLKHIHPDSRAFIPKEPAYSLSQHLQMAEQDDRDAAAEINLESPEAAFEGEPSKRRRGSNM